MSVADKFKPKERKMKMWSNGKIIVAPKNITSLNFVLHYGSPAVWEGIRCYRQNDGTSEIFRLHHHINRFFDSAKIINLNIPFSKSDLLEACKALIAANGGGDLYIRPIAYSNQDAESVRSKNGHAVNVDIYTFPIPPLHDRKEGGIRVIVSSHRRGYPQFQMQAKTPANYTFSQLAKSEMEMAHVDDVFFMDNQGFVVEATVANIFVIKDGLVFTPPNNGSILEGITRATMLEMFLDTGNLFRHHKQVIQGVGEKNITRADLYTADEVFICGTYAEVVPVVEIDGRKIGDGKPGQLTKMVQNDYQKLVRGIR